MQELRRWIALCESAESYRVYHGSPYDNIEQFRLHDLRQRTGTPGTLSFSTSIETAKIYGKYIYEVRAQGNFGDYLDPKDIDSNFAYRWPRRESSVIHNYPETVKWRARFNKPPHTLDEVLAEVAAKDRKEMADGQYFMWESVGLWRAMGWDGAWCIESGSRNLIVGNLNCIHLIGKMALDNQMA